MIDLNRLSTEAAKELLDYCFDNFEMVEIVNKNDFIATYTEEENKFNKMSNFKKKRYQN